MTRSTHLGLLAVLGASRCAEAFVRPPSTPPALFPRCPSGATRRFVSDSEKEGGGGGEGASSFDQAAADMQAEADAEALERTSGMDAQEEAAFKARSGEFASMKDRIRSRATDLGVEKSVATAEAIKAAEKRARSKQASPTLDMSIFEGGDPEDNPMLFNPEDELSEEERKSIDPVGEMTFLEQAFDEFKNTAFPGPLDVAKTVGFMAVTFVVSASFILKADELLRGLYTEWGFIPGPDAQLDYSDLELPADWDKDLDDLTGVLADVVEAATKNPASQ
mmetsp:Transcript_10955/g.22929  ORF Transcript_10955/g.22929 Transcript_10955/m.22929 type:complete len:278 (-) Transcript_10955:312-1145(-)